MVSKEWTVRLSIDEQGDLTRALAVLSGDNGVVAHAEGRARRNPADRWASWIGDELAASRALYALADRLMDTAARDIDVVAGRG